MSLDVIVDDVTATVVSMTSKPSTSTVAAQMGQGAVRIAAAARGVALLLALLLAAPLLPAARFFMTNLSMKFVPAAFISCSKLQTGCKAAASDLQVQLQGGTDMSDFRRPRASVLLGASTPAEYV